MRTVLLVDDYEGVLRSLEFVLNHHGYRTVSALSGRAALELAGHEPVAGALIDLHMPGMDGFKTCEALRAQSAATGVPFPIWIMTGAFSSEAARRAQEIGAVGLLSKPFDCAAFVREFETRLLAPSGLSADVVTRVSSGAD